MAVTFEPDGVAVCIAAFNEERTIGKLVREIVDLGLDPVIVVDDGSRDHTFREAEKAGALASRLLDNSGQWVALRHAFRTALDSDAKVVVTFDADGQHQPKSIPELARPVLNDEADISVASRLIENGFDGKEVRRLGISALNVLLWLLTKHRFTDCTSGLTAIRSSILRGALPLLTEPQFGRVEFWLTVARNSPRIIEIPTTMRPNRFSNKGQVRFAANLLRTVVRTTIVQG